MANYLNYYTCPVCEHEWKDEWSCACDDECPECGTGDISPYHYEVYGPEEDSLTFIEYEASKEG